MNTAILKARGLFLLGMLLSIFAFPAGAATVTLAPTDDMYSDPNHADPNELGELWVANYSGAQHYERIMMKFDTSEIGRDVEVESALLHIYRFFRCPNDPYTETYIFAGTQDWDEDTWNCHQHLPHEADPRYSFTFGPNNTWYHIDITALVQDWVDEAIANCGLVIEGKLGEKWSKFYSKDYVNPSLHPYLDVTFEEVGVADGLPLGGRLSLGNYPNPFNPRTTFQYMLPEAGYVSLRIYDQQGRLLCFAFNGYQTAGSHEFIWEAMNEQGEALSTGVYFYVLSSGADAISGKMLLLK